ncbi:hypothetical protein ACI2JA_11805 [Alkalihalobacillus sp. NPDC078783]
MNVKEARRVAFEWVSQFSSRHLTFHSAYLAGSITELKELDELTQSSDVDVFIVVNSNDVPLKPGKIRASGVCLDITYLPWSVVRKTDNVQRSYHLANSLKKNTILLDPTGELQQVQSIVESQFYQRKWVEARCEDARSRITNNLDTLPAHSTWAEQVTGWLFAAGVMTHVLLVADVRNPTVRLRYLRVKEMLHHYGLDHIYIDLLNFLGCQHLTPTIITSHLEQLEETFDVAASVAKTPLFFSTDLTQEAKAISIQGSRDLIAAGHHHEAIFWMVATYARCHQIFTLDAPHLLSMKGFNKLLLDLGIRSPTDLNQRANKVREYLPELKKQAQYIMSINSRIEEGVIE